MNATLLYRIAAALLLLFAVLHTFGFLGFKPPTAEGLAVRDAMTSAVNPCLERDACYSDLAPVLLS